MDARSWLRRFRKKLRPARPTILMYHRVAHLERDPWGLAVSPENFRDQLRLLSRERDILPLEDFVARLRENRLPRRAVAITFDDGYRDNLVNAAPLLAKFDAPATLFLATGPMREQRGYWWDLLEAMVLDSPAVEGKVRVGAEEVAFRLGPQGGAGPRPKWRAWHPPRSDREALYYQLWSLIRPRPPGEVADIMAELATLFPHWEAPEQGPMGSAEVGTLLASSPFTLGCHTVDHPDLPAIHPDLARAQLVDNKAEVEALANRPVTCFAYPYGRHDEKVVALARDVGFAHACTTTAGPMRGANPLALPRATAMDRASIGWLAS